VADGLRPIAVLIDREGLGDVLLKRPFLKALRGAFPDHPIWWIVTHQTSMEDELRELVGRDVDRVISRSGLDGPVLPLARRLRALPPFERVFDARTKAATVAVSRFVLRHRGFYCCLPGFALCDGSPPPGRRRPTHVAARMNALIACATGRPAPPPRPITPSPAADERARASLPDGRIYLGFAPGSRVEGREAASREWSLRKRWPMERFLEAARGIAGAGLTPVFFLGPSESIPPEEITAAAPGAMVIGAAGGPAAESLDVLVAQGRRLCALVANDNGVGHLIGAVGAPVVSLFGPTSPLKWAPVAPVNIVLWSRDFGGDDDVAAIEAPQVVTAALAAAGRGSPPANARLGRFGLLEPA